MKKFELLAFILIVFSLCVLCYQLPRTKDLYVNLNPHPYIFIDPGHGGKDDGASYEGVLEDEINLNIAEFLYEKCINNNYTSRISRVDDYDLASNYASNRKREDLKKRVDLINHSGADIYVSIHVNAFQNKKIHGPMVYYKSGDEISKLLADCSQLELNNLSKVEKVAHPETYYLFKHCTVKGILIECGFLSNDMEREQLVTSKYQEEIATCIYNGINNFFKQKT